MSIRSGAQTTTQCSLEFEPQGSIDNVSQLLDQYCDGRRWRRVGRHGGRCRAPLPDRPGTRAHAVQHRGDRIMTAVQTETLRVASRDEWLTARKALLQREKELTYLREETPRPA